MTLGPSRRRAAVIGVAVLAVIGADIVDAQRGPGGGRRPMLPREPAESELSPEMAAAFAPTRATPEGMQARGLFATGLTPVYPGEASCPVVTSAFGVTTRGDGSLRVLEFFNGRHGGMDLPAPDGTPILAAAAGVVVHKAEGASIGGIGIILQHAPADAGMPVWTYTEYKHLEKMPALEPGTRVRAGEPIARVGRTGTQNGYYGAAGHAHLHLSAWYSAKSEYRSGRVFVPEDGYWMDPLALFKAPLHASAALRDLPERDKRVAIPYVTTAGAIVPPGAKVVWPLPCRPR